jgi:hypothetical protein
MLLQAPVVLAAPGRPSGGARSTAATVGIRVLPVSSPASRAGRGRGTQIFAGYAFGRSAGSLSSVRAGIVVPLMRCARSRRIRDSYEISFGVGLSYKASSPRGASAEVDESCQWMPKGQQWSYRYTARVGAAANTTELFRNTRSLAVRAGQRLGLLLTYARRRATARLTDLTSGRSIRVSASGVARLPDGAVGAIATLSEQGPFKGSGWTCGPTRSPTGADCPIPPFGTAHFRGVQVDGHALSRAPRLVKTFLAYESRRRVNVATTGLVRRGTAFGTVFRQS